MKTAGIIAEYNPFHNGHLYQIEKVKSTLGADYVVVVSSGDFVQRGAPALLEKHVRAAMALSCGADLVLELPVCASAASAEFFAMGAVSILEGIGITDFLCFGAEDADPQKFSRAADLLLSESESYKEELGELLRQGLSYPAARSRALSPLLSEYPDMADFLSRPNNILGIEYVKALKRQRSSITPLPVKRAGAGYHQEEINPGEFPSASALRKKIESGDTSFLQGMIPDPALPYLEQSIRDQALIFESDLDPLIRYKLLWETPESLMTYPDISPDLARKIYRLRYKCEGFSSFAALLHSRDLTRSRVKRCLLHVLLNMKKRDPILPYARILGFRREALPLLKEMGNKTRIPVISKASDASRKLDPPALEIFMETIQASHLYESILSTKTKKAFRHEFEKPLVIL